VKTEYSIIKRMPGKRLKQRGFTLLETLIALAVTAVLLGIALPNLTEYSSSRAVRSKATSLSGSLRLARAESIRRGNRVTVCQSSEPILRPRHDYQRWRRRSHFLPQWGFNRWAAKLLTFDQSNRFNQCRTLCSPDLPNR